MWKRESQAGGLLVQLFCSNTGKNCSEAISPAAPLYCKTESSVSFTASSSSHAQPERYSLRVQSLRVQRDTVSSPGKNP